MKARMMTKKMEKQVFFNISDPLRASLGFPPQLPQTRQQQKQQPTRGMTRMKMSPIAMQIA